MIHLHHLSSTSIVNSQLYFNVWGICILFSSASSHIPLSRSLGEMIIDRYDMGVTIDISPGVLVCKSKHIDIDFCTAHVTVRACVMDRLWFILCAQWARWRTCRRRLLTSRVRLTSDGLVIIQWMWSMCVCLSQLAGLYCLSICFMPSGTWWWPLYAYLLFVLIQFLSSNDTAVCVLTEVWFRVEFVYLYVE